MVYWICQQKGVRLNLEHRDAGDTTALITAIFSSNVWTTRELLLAGSSVTYGGVTESSAYDISVFIYCAGI
jgi:hypothetical protein